mgnify:CR=1 FL=1
MTEASALPLKESKASQNTRGQQKKLYNARQGPLHPVTSSKKKRTSHSTQAQGSPSS